MNKNSSNKRIFSDLSNTINIANSQTNNNSNSSGSDDDLPDIFNISDNNKSENCKENNLNKIKRKRQHINDENENKESNNIKKLKLNKLKILNEKNKENISTQNLDDSVQIISQPTSMALNNEPIEIKEIIASPVDNSIIIESKNIISTSKLIQKLAENIQSNKQSLIHNPIDTMPSFDLHDRPTTTSKLSSFRLNDSKNLITHDEEDLFRRVTNANDLRLHAPIRAPNTQIFNRNVGFENDLKRLSNQMFKILEKKPDENKFDPTKFQMPKGLRVKLLDHQCRAMSWLKWREECFPNGCILADDMGLGKTLTILSYLKLIKENNDDNLPKEEESLSEEDDFSIEILAKKIQQNAYKTKTSNENRLKTLIVLPASLLHQWQNEIKSKFDKNSFKIQVYHGSSRKELTLDRLKDCDIVLTTYDVVARETNQNDTATLLLSKSPLVKIKWDRIICDEAHRIKNSSSQINQAMCNLESKYRIVITGTPIHNSMCDLYSLLKFLRFYPLNDKSLFTYLFPSDKKATKTEEEERRTNAWIIFLSEFLLLRRLKTDTIKDTNQKIVELPEKKLEIIKFELSESEKCIYDKIFQESKENVRSLLINQRAKQYYLNSYGQVNFSDVLVYILRLRQACCHLNLIHQVVDMNELNNLQEEFEEKEDLIEKKKEFVSNQAQSSSRRRETRFFSIGNLQNENPELIKCFESSFISSKMAILIEMLDKILEEFPDDKIIIVSQWTGYLNLMAQNLRLNRIEYCEINGRKDLNERNEVVEYFNNKNNMDIRVMLLSLCAGGVGLNLIGANHMFLLDIHWNPALESQAFDRIYRVGQTKNVFIYKFLCMNTIEEKIQEVQRKKVDLADRFCSAKASNIPGMSAAGSARLTIQDLKMLFELI